MNKKISSVLLWLSLLAAPAAQAQLTYITNNNQIVITGCVGGGNVTIPSVTNGLPVTSITNQAFQGNTLLTSVIIGANVTNIGTNAFSGCTALTNVTIPDSVITLDNYAFEQCSSLSNITIGNGVTSIGEYAFYDCSALAGLTIGTNVTYIGEYAFYECSVLTNLTIPNSVTNIGDYAFYECYALTSATIGNGVTSIGEYAFYDCSALASATIGNSVTSIGEEAFEDCSALASITIPNSVTNIGEAAFYECSALTSATIGNSVTSIGEEAFDDCSALASITIPNSVTNIGEDAFEDCYALKSATIGNSVTSIGESAFDDCYALASITIPNSVTNLAEYAFEDCYALTNVTIGNGIGTIPDYAFYYCPSLTTVTIGSGVTNLYAADAFYECPVANIVIANGASNILEYEFEDLYSLTSVTIPNTVTNIGEEAFYGCYALASVTIPNSVTSIGEEAFYECSALKSATIGSSVTSLGEYAFEDCYALTSVTIPNSVTNIEEYAFYYCYALTNVTIGNGIGTIPDYAFYYCPSLTTVTIGSGVTNFYADDAFYDSPVANIIIANGASNIFAYEFEDLDSLTSVTIPDTVTNIGEEAFEDCYALASVTIPNSVTSVGEYAFEDCYALTNATIGNSVTDIGEEAFEDCYALPSVTIPNSVTNIEEDAFEYCYALTNVTIGNSVATIGEDAFYECYALNHLMIPNSVTNLGEYAFQDCTSLASVYFQGNAPRTNNDLTVFSDATPTVYYLAGATGWSSTFDGRPAVMLNPATLQVTVSPAGAIAAGAQWQVDGGSYQNSGATISNLFPIAHTVTFSTISNWITPAAVTETLAGNQTTTITGTYIPLVGTVQVTISPAEAVAAGAQWQLDGGSNQNSGTALGNVLVGSHSVTFLPVPGWITPPAETVMVSFNQTTVTNATYIPTTQGALVVTLSPAGAISNGAQWQVDGGSIQNSGAIVSNLSGGTHVVSFTPAAGWTPPLDLFVTITNGATTMAAGVYTSSVATSTLVLLTNGSGTIEHKSLPQNPVNGTSYTIKAVPDSGNIFVNWVGGANPPYAVLGTNESLSFTVQSNLVLEANFVTNAFLAAQGDYSGLFAPESETRQQTNSGSFNFTLTKTGMVSGKLYIGSETATLSGQFKMDGSATLISTPKGANKLTTTLQLDMAGQAVEGTVSDGNFVAQLTGDQNVFSSRNPAGYAGKYTLIIPGATNPAVGPYGTSYGIVTVSSSGAVTFSGSLADGTSVSQSSAVSADGRWPFYVNLYDGRGSLWGWNYFVSNTITASPSLSWINAGNSSKTASGAGFTNQQAALIGSLYVPTSALPAGLASVTLVGGGLSSDITNGVMITAGNKISLTNSADETSKLTLTVAESTGVISGTFVNPTNASQKIKVNGVILQDYTNASGYFLNDGQSGAFVLEPQ